MIAERARPARAEAEQRRALRHHVRREICAYSAWWRQRLADAGVSAKAVRGPADLARLEPIGMLDADPAGLLLRPDPSSIISGGSRGLAWRFRLARLVGATKRVTRSRVELDFKPIHWLVEAGVPIGCSASDLERLAELGRRWLDASGLRQQDAMVSVLGATPTLGFWELNLGARLAGLPLAAVGPKVDVEGVVRLGPTVLVGAAPELIGVLETWRPTPEDGVHTLLVLGRRRLDPATRKRLEALVPAAAVLEAWAPAGCRSLWFQCRGGEGLHTEPGVEFLEAVDEAGLPLPAGQEGEILWTSVGWRGSVFIRLRTGVRGRLTPMAPCPKCGRTSPRVLLEPAPPDLGVVLDRQPTVAAWQLELRPVNQATQVVVYLAAVPGADLGELLSILDADLEAAQYVVLAEDELRARIGRCGGSLVLDRT